MKISVIIPTLNEVRNIEVLINHLKVCLKNSEHEIVVSDGGSDDGTVEKAKKLGVIVLECERMSRAYQMNQGANRAKYGLLYFVHADALPPNDFYGDLMKAVNEGFDLGCFRFRFNSDSILLAMNAYFTRFDRMVCRGGDQTLFVKRDVFEKLKGFKNDFQIMEDYDFIKRARVEHRFKIIPNIVTVSARKYENNSYLRVNFANFIVFTLYRIGASQERMIKIYKNLINHPKAETLQ